MWLENAALQRSIQGHCLQNSGHYKLFCVFFYVHGYGID